MKLNNCLTSMRMKVKLSEMSKKIAFLCYEMLCYSEKVMLYYLIVVKVIYNSSSNKKANQFAFFSL